MRTSMSGLGSLHRDRRCTARCGDGVRFRRRGEGQRESAAGTPSPTASSAPSAPIPGTPAAGTPPSAAPSSGRRRGFRVDRPAIGEGRTHRRRPPARRLCDPACGRVARPRDRATATPAYCQPLVDPFLSRQGATKPAAVAQAFVSIGTPIPTGVIGSGEVVIPDGSAVNGWQMQAGSSMMLPLSLRPPSTGRPRPAGHRPTFRFRAANSARSGAGCPARGWDERAAGRPLFRFLMAHRIPIGPIAVLVRRSAPPERPSFFEGTLVCAES